MSASRFVEICEIITRYALGSILKNVWIESYSPMQNIFLYFLSLLLLIFRLHNPELALASPTSFLHPLRVPFIMLSFPVSSTHSPLHPIILLSAFITLFFLLDFCLVLSFVYSMYMSKPLKSVSFNDLSVYTFFIKVIHDYMKVFCILNVFDGLL